MVSSNPFSLDVWSNIEAFHCLGRGLLTRRFWVWGVGVGIRSHAYAWGLSPKFLRLSCHLGCKLFSQRIWHWNVSEIQNSWDGIKAGHSLYRVFGGHSRESWTGDERRRRHRAGRMRNSQSFAISSTSVLLYYFNVTQFRYDTMPTNFNTYSNLIHYKQFIHFLNK